MELWDVETRQHSTWDCSRWLKYTRWCKINWNWHLFQSQLRYFPRTRRNHSSFYTDIFCFRFTAMASLWRIFWFDLCGTPSTICEYNSSIYIFISTLRRSWLNIFNGARGMSVVLYKAKNFSSLHVMWAKVELKPTAFYFQDYLYNCFRNAWIAIII